MKMTNESLEKLIFKNGLKPNSEIADRLRIRCSFLSSISQDEFDFFLKRISNEEAQKQARNKTLKKLPPKEQILRYGKAIGYVVKRASRLNATMLVANVDPVEEKNDELYYTTSSLDKEIDKAVKFNYYLEK